MRRLWRKIQAGMIILTRVISRAGVCSRLVNTRGPAAPRFVAGLLIFALILGMFPVGTRAEERQGAGDTFYQNCEVLHPELTNPITIHYNQKAQTLYAFASENDGAYYRLTVEGGKYTGYSLGVTGIQYPNQDGTFNEVSNSMCRMSFSEAQAKMPLGKGCTMTQSRVIWLPANVRMKFCLEPYPNANNRYAEETPDITLTLEKLSLAEADIDWGDIELHTAGLNYYDCFNAAGLTVNFGGLATSVYFDGTENKLLEMEWFSQMHNGYFPSPGQIPSLDVTLAELYADAGDTVPVQESAMEDGNTYYGILSIAGSRVNSLVPILKKPDAEKGSVTGVSMKDEYTQNFGESTPYEYECSYTAEYSDGRYFPYEEKRYKESGNSCFPLYVTNQKGETESFTSIDDAAEYLGIDSTVEYGTGYFQVDFDGLIVKKEAKIYSNPYCAINCPSPAKTAYVYGGGEKITKEDLAVIQMELKEGAAKNTLTSFDMRKYPEYERNHLIWNLDFGVDLGDGTLSKDIDLIADTLGPVGTQTVDMTVVYSGCVPPVSTTYPITIQGLPYDSIEVVDLPDRLVYAGPDCGSIGSIDLTGMKIRAHVADTGEYDEFTYTGHVDSNGILLPDSFEGTALENYDKASIKSYFKCSVASGWGSTNGKYAVTVSVMKQTATFDITALRRPLKSCELVKEPDNLRIFYLDWCWNSERMSLDGAVLRMEFYTDWEWNEETESYGHTYTEELTVTGTNDQMQADVQPKIYLPNKEVDEGYKIRVQGDSYGSTHLNCSLTLRSGGKDGLQVGKINNAFTYEIKKLSELDVPEFDDIEEAVETSEEYDVIRRMQMPCMGVRLYKVTADEDYECTFSCTQSNTRYNGRVFRVHCYTPDNEEVAFRQVDYYTTNTATATLDHWKMYKGDVVYLIIDPNRFSASDTTTFTMKLRREPLERTPVETVDLTVNEPAGGQDIEKIEAPAGANYTVTGGWMQDGKFVEGKKAEYASEYALSLRLDVKPGYRFGKKDGNGEWTDPDITLGNDRLRDFTYKMSDGGRIIVITFSPIYTDCKVDVTAAGDFTKHEENNAKAGLAAYGSDYQFYFTDAAGEKTADLVVKDGDEIILPDENNIYWLYGLKRCASVTSSIKKDAPGADETLLKFYENKNYQNPPAAGGEVSYNLIDTMTGKAGASIRDNTSGRTSLPVRASYYPEGNTFFFYGWYWDVNENGNGVGERFISSTKIPETADKTLPLYAKWDPGIFEVNNLTCRRVFRHKVLSYDEDNHLNVAITDMGPMMSAFSMRANKTAKSGDEKVLVLSNDFDVQKISEELNVEINDIAVTEIADRAFADKTEITRIVLPDTVKRIGANAFAGCTGLEEIVITSPDTKLADGAFFNCDNVTVFFPENTKTVNPLAFVGSSGMKVVFNDGDADSIASMKILKGMGVTVDRVSVSLDKGNEVLSIPMDEEDIIKASLLVNEKVQEDAVLAWSYTDKEGTVELTEGQPVERAAHSMELRGGVLTLTPKKMVTKEDGVFVTAADLQSGQKKSIALATVATDFSRKVEGEPVYAASVQCDTLFYTGEEICPAVTVKRGETVLDASCYQATYEDNVEVGQAKVTVSGVAEKGYTGELTASFTIGKGIQEISADESQTVLLDEKGAKVQAVLVSGDGELSFENSDDDIAVIAEDGTITPKKAGTTTVTVRAAETEHYKASAVSISLTVTGAGGEPTAKPSAQPTADIKPTLEPTSLPSGQPTAEPGGQPTKEPGGQQTETPDGQATKAPDGQPTKAPDGQPTKAPSGQPTETPDGQPTETPDGQPTKAPSGQPTEVPSGQPTTKPGARPTDMPGTTPTAKPDTNPTAEPTVEPTASQKPTAAPGGQPTAGATPTAVPDIQPTGPAAEPTASPVPAAEPTAGIKPGGQPTATPGSSLIIKPPAQPAKLPAAQNTGVGIKDSGITSIEEINVKPPARVVISKVKAARKKLTVMWKKVKNADGYRIQIAEDKKFKKKKKQYKVSAKKLKKIFTGLKAKKIYYIRISAWRKDSGGETLYGKYSKIKKVKTK